MTMGDVSRDGSEVIFTLSATTKKEVDDFAEKVKKFGGKIFIEPAEIQPDFYGFGFQDLDGHKWNMFVNLSK